MTTTATRRREQADHFADGDCILITGAGLEALHTAPVVPDDTEEENAEDGSTEEDTAEAFLPDTAEKVDWVLGKIADRRAAAARIRENAELMARAEDREAEALEWRFGPALQAFTRKELEGGKRRSVRLFHGVLGYRTKPAGVCVTDPAAALGWAQENLPAAVTLSLDKKALSAALLETGEAVPFAEFQAPEDVFYIKS